MENNQEIIENAELNMMSSINHLETELAKIRAGKANPIMLKGVSWKYDTIKSSCIYKHS